MFPERLLTLKYYSINIVFIDEVEEIKRRITDEAGGRVCNATLDPDTEAINDI